jgi:succinyl-diaminopimelate desuccinylase
MINFKEEVEKRKSQIILDLQTLVRFKSELTTFNPNRKNAPFGEGIQKAFEWFLALAKRDGFETANVEGYAGHIQFGKQETFVGSIGHLDVVPAGNGWTYDPYGAVIHEGKIYGRGTSDDKGPTMGVYYAMKIIKDLGLDLKHRIKLILGNDEETAWRGVDRYFQVYPETPVSGFIPDADFPLIYAEKGISRIQVKGNMAQTDILYFEGGFRDNMVPDFAKVILKANQPYQKLFENYLKKHHYKGNIEVDQDTVICVIHGKSAHGSLPHEGINAIDLMMQFLLEEEKSSFTKLYEIYFLNDIYGKKLGIFHEDQEMGPTTNNIGVMRIEAGKYDISLNYRYPHGIQFDEVINILKSTLTSSTIEVDHHKALLYNDPNSPLIQTLTSVYQDYTNDYINKPFSIGGGTYARSMPNVVAFGAHFPNTPTYIHQPDEYIDIDELMLATAIYAEAFYRLATQ